EIGLSGQAETSHLCEELLQGRKYEVVITTGAGLYRYRTGDMVEVTGKLNDCPLIRFLGRHKQVSDWFGEKLNEVHVTRTLARVFEDHDIAPMFAMLACDTRPAPGYVLYVDTNAPDCTLGLIGRSIEKALCGNFHYDYARQLGQLAPVRVFRA